MIFSPELATRHEQGGGLSERLQIYSRYVALIAEQLQAVQRRDARSVRQLEMERTRLEAEMAPGGAAARAEHPAAVSGPPGELSDLLLNGLVELEQVAHDEEQISECWSAIERGALQAARRLGGRLRPSQPGNYTAQEPLSGTVDVRF